MLIISSVNHSSCFWVVPGCQCFALSKSAFLSLSGAAEPITVSNTQGAKQTRYHDFATLVVCTSSSSLSSSELSAWSSWGAKRRWIWMKTVMTWLNKRRKWL